MTKEEVIERTLKDIRKHLDKYEYCMIKVVRKGKEIKGNITVFDGEFETITTQEGTTYELESEENK